MRFFLVVLHGFYIYFLYYFSFCKLSRTLWSNKKTGSFLRLDHHKKYHFFSRRLRRFVKKVVTIFFQSSNFFCLWLFAIFNSNFHEFFKVNLYSPEGSLMVVEALDDIGDCLQSMAGLLHYSFQFLQNFFWTNFLCFFFEFVWPSYKTETFCSEQWRFVPERNKKSAMRKFRVNGDLRNLRFICNFVEIFGEAKFEFHLNHLFRFNFNIIFLNLTFFVWFNFFYTFFLILISY